MAGPTGTRWYLLVLAISLLLYRHRVSGNLDDDIKYKGPESNDQLNKAVSVSPNRMGLEYICESNDQLNKAVSVSPNRMGLEYICESNDQLNKAVSVSANRMGLEYICHQENSQQFCHETLHPSTHESITTSSPPMHPRKRIRIDSLSLPESGGAADPSVRLDGALGPASSPCTSEQPESDNTLSKPSQVNHHNDINSSRQCDYKIHPRRWHFRSDSNRVIRGLYCPLHQFLSDQYKLSDRVPSDPRRSLGYMSASYSPRSSLNDRTSRINTEVKNILQGNTHDRLGYEFPEDIANLGFMDKYLENAEAGCLAQRDQVHSGDSEDSNLDKTSFTINDIYKSIMDTGASISLRSLFSFTEGLSINAVLRERVGKNTIIGILFKRTVTDRLRVRFIWLPDNDKYTCNEFAGHLKRHYFFVHAFYLLVSESVEYTLARYLDRFYEYIESGGNDEIAAYLRQADKRIHEQEMAESLLYLKQSG